MFNRRQWLRGAAALGCAPLLRALSAAGAAPVSAVSRPLEILVLGGTGFLGPHQVNYALGRGHRVTLFNRGLSAAGLFGDRVELLRGDRDAHVGLGLAALEGSRRWDVVIDNSGFLPRHVRDAATLLRGRVAQYVFVSSGAVYDGTQAEVFDERGPLRRLADAAAELQSPETYGPLKAECERVVAQLCAGRCTIVRPTYVFGPGDDTDRFTYWIERLALGGEVLGPPQPDFELQWVDVRDLSPWIVQLAERRVFGTFNAAGPAAPASWRAVLDSLASPGDPPPTIRWATDELLEQLGLALPLVAPHRRRRHLVSDAAQATGLAYRPLAQTVAATRAWWERLPEARRAAPQGWPAAALERRALELLRAGTGTNVKATAGASATGGG